MLEKITRVGEFRKLAKGVDNRFVVFPDEAGAHSPFVLLVEDFIDPASPAFAMHPHRGFETVTLLLAGQERIEDHLGTTGTARAGDVQWTTAGRGIFHGGYPVGDEGLHVLQLWLNLPASLKRLDPATHLQRLEETPMERLPGREVLVHAGRWGALSQPHRSHWPLALLSFNLKSGSIVAPEVCGSWRSFFYVLRGAVSVYGQQVHAGEVGWLPHDAQAGIARAPVAFTALGDAHMVRYSAPPIDEKAVLGGPFVMNTTAEIDEAYAALKDGSFLDGPRPPPTELTAGVVWKRFVVNRSPGVPSRAAT